MDVPDVPIISEHNHMEQTPVGSVEQTTFDSNMIQQPDQDISIPEKYTRFGKKVQTPNNSKTWLFESI